MIQALLIAAPANGPQRPYINSATLNGVTFEKVYLTHGQITAGGQLQLNLESSPNFHWATGEFSRPAAPISSLPGR